MRIEWNKVTWYSKLVAIVVFVGVFFLGFYLGGLSKEVNSEKQENTFANAAEQHTTQTSDVINNVVFTCPTEGQWIHAVFHKNRTVNLDLWDGRAITLPQARSADGARYANADESFVFWNKGNSALIQENGTTTVSNCVIK